MKERCHEHCWTPTPDQMSSLCRGGGGGDKQGPAPCPESHFGEGDVVDFLFLWSSLLLYHSSLLPGRPDGPHFSYVPLSGREETPTCTYFWHRPCNILANEATWLRQYGVPVLPLSLLGCPWASWAPSPPPILQQPGWLPRNTVWEGLNTEKL